MSSSSYFFSFERADLTFFLLIFALPVPSLPRTHLTVLMHQHLSFLPSVCLSYHYKITWWVFKNKKNKMTNSRPQQKGGYAHLP